MVWIIIEVFEPSFHRDTAGTIRFFESRSEICYIYIYFVYFVRRVDQSKSILENFNKGMGHTLEKVHGAKRSRIRVVDSHRLDLSYELSVTPRPLFLSSAPTNFPTDFRLRRSEEKKVSRTTGHERN